MTRWLGNGLVGLAALAVLLFGCDWAVWHMRSSRGSGMGKVTVSRIQVASLKGNKEEYYSDAPIELDCSRSIFPQAGSGACWWLERHNVVFDR